MTLPLFILVPLVFGFLGWLGSRVHEGYARWLSLVANLVNLVLALLLWLGAAGAVSIPGLITTAAGSRWMAEISLPWIPGLGITFALSLDGLSLTMIALTALLGAASVLASWTGITERVGFFHFNLSLVLAGVNGVFLATDLFLFAFFWELMLVPMYFLIDIWGHENRHKAAVKFFLFTQIGGLLMLVAIIGLAVVHAMATGTWSFAYGDLLGTAMSPVVGMLLMLGFFAGFAVKLPAFPFHTWLPDAHTEAPTAGSVILAGLLLKTGGYGLIRFVIPLFPEASRQFAPIAMAMAVAGIIYGGVMAFSQTDMKRVVANTSVSHLGFVLLGVYAFTPQALSGAVLQMVAHGISTGAMFILVGALQDRIHTRDLTRMGGLWSQAPLMGAAGLALSMALVGLPGLVN
ncbi:MAG TPA: NADH-quinone oxidoreductase subunit M, partial [Spirochaetia bacterium]